MTVGVRWLVLVAALSATGCSFVGPSIRRDATPEAGKGYVSGGFTADSGNTWFGFVLRDELGHDHGVTFDRGVEGAPAGVGKLGLTPLPPGNYRVVKWVTYDPLTRDVQSSSPVPEGHVIARPFELRPGHVVFLGTFRSRVDAEFYAMRMHHTMQIAPRPIAADQIVPLVQGAYPAFAGLPIECVVCTAPSPEATAAAAPAPGPSWLYGKKVAIHYWRADGCYEGWTLALWESFEKEAAPGDAAASGARPRMVAGLEAQGGSAPLLVDERGAHWAVEAANFANGKVNFAVRKGRQVDAGAGARSWLIGDRLEVWLNADDPSVYGTEEEARKARGGEHGT